MKQSKLIINHLDTSLVTINNQLYCVTCLTRNKRFSYVSLWLVTGILTPFQSITHITSLLNINQTRRSIKTLSTWLRSFDAVPSTIWLVITITDPGNPPNKNNLPRICQPREKNSIY